MRMFRSKTTALVWAAAMAVVCLLGTHSHCGRLSLQNPRVRLPCAVPSRDVSPRLGARVRKLNDDAGAGLAVADRLRAENSWLQNKLSQHASAPVGQPVSARTRHGTAVPCNDALLQGVELRGTEFDHRPAAAVGARIHWRCCHSHGTRRARRSNGGKCAIAEIKTTIATCALIHQSGMRVVWSINIITSHMPLTACAHWPEACCEQCSASKDCVGFTFNTDEKLCRLKSSILEVIVVGAQHAQSMLRDSTPG